ncbi:hypothetical protein M2405_006159 [Rhodococcus erythropolis]|nr:hypothetical protein [Rhodococcus erythropolis]MCW2425135.1 hypothetical protein [Rhodococcus erythropolis]
MIADPVVEPTEQGDVHSCMYSVRPLLFCLPFTMHTLGSRISCPRCPGRYIGSFRQ